MASDSTTPEIVHSYRAKTQLRTYSRRGLKRRLTSPPASVDEEASQQIQRFSSTAPETESENKRSAEHKLANAGRKRARLSLPTTSGKTPTELFLEHMNSSFVLSQHLQKQERATRLEQSLQDDQEIATLGAAQDDEAALHNKSAEEPVKIIKDQEKSIEAHNVLKVAAVEKIPLSNENPEEPGGHDGSSDADLDFFSMVNNKTSNRRVRRYKLLSLSPPVNQKSKAKGPFLDTPKPSPPPGFKTIPKVQSRLGITGYYQKYRHTTNAFKITKPTNEQPFKADKHISDGFTNDEAQPSPFRKTERRTKSTLSEAHIGGLELTQRGAATQKMEGPTWLRGQKRSRAATTASLWGKRQSLDSSQFQIESQDPLETFDINEEPESEVIHNAGRSRRLIREIADEDEAELDLLVHPAALDEKNSQKDAGEDEGLLMMVENQQDSAEQYISDADEPVVLLEIPGDEDDLTTVPRTDTPEPDDGDTCFGSWGNIDLDLQLPPKRTWDVLNHDGDSLALRPDSREWQREVTRILETPPRKDAVGHQ